MGVCRPNDELFILCNSGIYLFFLGSSGGIRLQVHSIQVYDHFGLDNTILTNLTQGYILKFRQFIVWGGFFFTCITFFFFNIVDQGISNRFPTAFGWVNTQRIVVNVFPYTEQDALRSHWPRTLTRAWDRMAWAWASWAETTGPLCDSPPARNCQPQGKQRNTLKIKLTRHF